MARIVLPRATMIWLRVPSGPSLNRPLSRGRGSAAPRRAYVAFVRTRKVLLEIFAHILPQNRIYYLDGARIA